MSTFENIVGYANILSAVFGFLAIIIAIYTLKQVQKINVKIVTTNSTKMIQEAKDSNIQNITGNSNKTAGGNYIEN